MPLSNPTKSLRGKKAKSKYISSVPAECVVYVSLLSLLWWVRLPRWDSNDNLSLLNWSLKLPWLRCSLLSRASSWPTSGFKIYKIPELKNQWGSWIQTSLSEIIQTKILILFLKSTCTSLNLVKPQSISNLSIVIVLHLAYYYKYLK